jgi:hypothetical protein
MPTNWAVIAEAHPGAELFDRAAHLQAAVTRAPDRQQRLGAPRR